MVHEPYVFLVHTHAECIGGNNDLCVTGHESLLDFVALFGLESAVVEERIDALFLQGAHDRLGVLPGRDVHDSGLIGPMHTPDQRLELLGLRREVIDTEIDVRAVESVHDDLRVPQSEPLDNLVAHVG